MNRRELLKAAIAAPVIAALPWYVEKPIEAMLPRWFGMDLGYEPSRYVGYAARYVWFDEVTTNIRWRDIQAADLWAEPEST
jgi:hypothetical protein